MPTVLQNGLGGVLGDSIATAEPDYVFRAANCVYVHHDGSSSNTGRDRTSPLDTVSAGVTALGGGGILVLLDGHTEEIGSAIALPSNSMLVGEGSNTGSPTVQLTLAAGSSSMFQVSNAAVLEIRNVRFNPPGNAASPGATTGGYIRGNSASADIRIIKCEFDMDEHNDAPGIIVPADTFGWVLERCTFTSVEATAPPASIPREAVFLGSTVSSMVVRDCVFDGGATGFEDSAGNPTAFLGGTDISGMVVENLTLLRGADFVLPSGTIAYIFGVTATGSSQIVWPD